KVFPKLWKEFYLAPIPKVEPCTNLEEIRPVALTSTISKIQESYVVDWMYDDMESTICKEQYNMVVYHARQQSLRSFTFYTNGIKHWTYHNE
ncbi:Hypothetical predicted protein, partial [Paramuricea clavata]